MKFSENKKLNYIGLFTINSQCNDHCKFCIKSDFINEGSSDLTLNEIKKNYFLIKDKFKIRHVSISGGEPTLHPQIFEILNFFKKEKVGVHMVTNLLKFNEKLFLKRIQSYFTKPGNRIMVSVNDLPDFSKTADLRIRGLIKLLRAGCNLATITVVYRDNIKHLPNLALLLKNLFRKYPPKDEKSYLMELRSLYVSETPKAILPSVLPDDFSKMKKAVEKFISILSSPFTRLFLWHLPLCYFDNFHQLDLEEIQRRWNRRYIWVDKFHQSDKIKILGYRRQQKICSSCILEKFCTGMCNKEYMDKYNFPPFKPIKKL